GRRKSALRDASARLGAINLCSGSQCSLGGFLTLKPHHKTRNTVPSPMIEGSGIVEDSEKGTMNPTLMEGDQPANVANAGSGGHPLESVPPAIPLPIIDS